MKVEDIRGEFEVANVVKSSAEVNQFPNFSQYESSELRTDAEVSEAVRQLPNLLNVQSPAVRENFAESTVLEVSENSRRPSSHSYRTATGRITSVESGSEKSVKRSVAEACCEFENVVNSVRSQNIEQLTAFDPTEFEGVPVSGEVIDAVVSEAVLPKKGGVCSRLDDEIVARAGARGQPAREMPRQPRSLSLMDPEAPTKFFGRTGQRQVTVVSRGNGVTEALVSGDNSKWTWSSLDQLDKAVNELMRGINSQSSSSQASLSAANIEAEGLSQ